MKALIKNSSILVLSNASLKIISFFLLPLYTNVLPPEAYGITDTILNASSLMASVFSLSLDWGMNTYFYEENRDSFYRKVTSSGMFYFTISSLMCLFCAVFSKQFSVLLFKEVDYEFAVILGIIAAGAKLFYFPQRVSTRMRGRLKIAGIISVVELSVTLLCNIIFILVCNFGYISIIWSSLIGQAAAMLLYTADARQYLSVKAVDFTLLKRMLSYSIPITPTLLFDWINNFLDRFFIGHYFSQAETGLYGIGARMTGVLSVLTGAFLSAYPSFAYSNAKQKENRERYCMVLDFLVMGLSAMAAAVTLFSKEIIQIMTAQEYHSAYTAVGILLFAHILHVLGVVAGYGITIQKKGILYLRISGTAALVNTAANFWFVPRYSFLGAAAATLFTEAVMFLISYYYSQKLFACGYHLKKIVICIAACLQVSYFSINLPISVKMAIYMGIAVFILYLYKNRTVYLFRYLKTAKRR